MMHNYRPIFPASLKFCFQFTKMDLYAEFPPLLESLEKWEGIFHSGKSQRILNKLEKSGKITQNTGKAREFQTDVIFIIFSDI